MLSKKAMNQKKFTLQLQDAAIDFCLPSTEGRFYSLKSFDSYQGIVIFFTCNHCPYVLGSDEDTKALAVKFEPKGIKFVAINSNSPQTYPEDSFEHMVIRMHRYQFPWVYLFDATQEIALRYGALRTPHFYLFDDTRRLIYCGRSTDSPKDPSKISRRDLEQALEQYCLKQPITTALTNPIGCTIKWKGKDPHWMPDEACDLI